MKCRYSMVLLYSSELRRKVSKCEAQPCVPPQCSSVRRFSLVPHLPPFSWLSWLPETL